MTYFKSIGALFILLLSIPIVAPAEPIYPVCPCPTDMQHQPQKLMLPSNTNANNAPLKKPATIPQPKPQTYLIQLYKPNYVLPFYYTGSPFRSIFQNRTPENQKIKNTEFNFQFSFKVPLLKHLFDRDSTLYAAYSQVSFWQAYTNSPFFRESNYEPEIFLANYFGKPLIGNWQLQYFNVGVVHQSNGRGGLFERSWNRLYAEVIFVNSNHWFLSFKPWYVFQDSSLRTHNPKITKYLGYGRTIISYKCHRQVLSFMIRNEVESGFRRGAVQVTYSFPITHFVRGYILGFDGYGQSLIEYDHRTDSIGVGVAFNDWQ